MKARNLALASLAILGPAAAASAQAFDIGWYTIDCGGGLSSAGVFSIAGTIGQPDAGRMSGGTFSISGGFYPGPGGGSTCYANCDGSTNAPVLNVNDFQCFLNRYAAGDPYANCDGSTSPPVLNVNDFQCFLNLYAAGCP